MPSQRIGATASEPGDEPMPLKRGRTTQEMLADRRGPGFGGAVLRGLLVLAVVLAVLVGLYLIASAIEGDEPVERAPWAERSAPEVRPASLDDQ